MVWRPWRTTILIPTLFLLTLITAYWMLMDDPSSFPSFRQNTTSSNSASHFLYSTVPGYFLQSDPSTPDQTFNLTATNFGLIHRTYPSDSTFPDPSSDHDNDPTASDWPRFLHHLSQLNAGSSRSTRYRLLFLSRHGQGYHNVAESFFGTRKWDCYYSTLNGTTNLTWADAHLTPLGIQQAESMRQLWTAQFRDQGMPWPDACYASPLDRAVTTAGIVFDAITPQHITIKELLREAIGIHTCDRRSTRSVIASRHPLPRFVIEDGFVEDDPFWRADLREPAAAQTARLTQLLDDVFRREEEEEDDDADGERRKKKKNLTISLTSHGGTISSILRAVRHRSFYVGTGSVVPVLIKLVKVDGQRPREEEVPWETKPNCEEDEDELTREGNGESALNRLDEHVNGLFP